MRDRYRIEWLEPAKQGLRDIVFYLIDKAPLVAIGIQEVFSGQLTVLEKFPHISQEKRTPLFNGAIECRLLGYKIVSGSNRK